MGCASEGGLWVVLEQTGYVVAERPSVPTWMTENKDLITTKISIQALSKKKISILAHLCPTRGKVLPERQVEEIKVVVYGWMPR